MDIKVPDCLRTIAQNHEGFGVVTEKEYESFWIENDKKKGGIRNFLVANPFDSEFSLQANEGIIVTPASLHRFTRDTRAPLMRLLSKQELPEETVTVDRDIYGTGEFLECNTFPREIYNGVIVTSEHGTPVDEAVLKSLYPEAEITRSGIATVLKLPRRAPVYLEQSEIATYGTERRYEQTPTVDNRERIDTTESLLTPELRSIIENRGNIVFESDPNGTDRLVICFKHLHGSQGDEMLLRQIDSPLARQFGAHQKNISHTVRELLFAVGPENMRLFFETYPLSFKSRDEEAVQELEMLATVAEIFGADVLDQVRSTQKMQDIHTLLGDFCSLAQHPEYNLEQICRSRGCQDIIFGDGRYENSEVFQQQKMELGERIVQAKKSGGGVGVATDLSRFYVQRTKSIFAESQRRTVMQMANVIGKGDIGVLTYGAGHFASGYLPERKREKLFEDYIQFLPRTQCIVVEEIHCKKAIESYDAMLERVEQLDNRRLERFVELKQQLASVITLLEFHCAMYVTEEESQHLNYSIDLYSMIKNRILPEMVQLVSTQKKR